MKTIQVEQSRESADEMLKRFNLREEEGFNYFFYQYYRKIVIFSFQIVKDQKVAEEIAADAFVTLWNKHASFVHHLSIRGFLYAVARNNCLTWLRGQCREKLLKTQLEYLQADSEKSLIDGIIAAEVYTEVFEAISSLPKQCQKIFRLHILEGKSIADIAAMLGLSESTIRNQKRRAILLLRLRTKI